MTDVTAVTPQEDVSVFVNHCVLMRSVFQHMKLLFANSSDNEKNMMSRAANIFFSDLNRIFVEYLTLQVCKITDPAKDRNNDNHTIAFLLQQYDLGADPAIATRLNELNDSLSGFREKLLPARHKFIAHSDRTAIMTGEALGSATDDEWNQFWLDLQDIVCIIHKKIVGKPFYINGVAMLSDAHGLLKALKHADCFDKLLHGSDPAISRRCIDLALS